MSTVSSSERSRPIAPRQRYVPGLRRRRDPAGSGAPDGHRSRQSVPEPGPAAITAPHQRSPDGAGGRPRENARRGRHVQSGASEEQRRALHTLRPKEQVSVLGAVLCMESHTPTPVVYNVTTMILWLLSETVSSS